MRRVISLLTIAALFIAASVVQAIEAPAVPLKKTEKTMLLTDADNGKTVPIAVGKLFDIALKGNATTGFQWQVDKIDGDAVQQLGKVDYVLDKNPKKMVGVGGKFVFHFKVVKPAKTEVRLIYVRPWEKDKPPAKKFAVVIDSNVKKPPKTAPTPSLPKTAY